MFVAHKSQLGLTITVWSCAAWLSFQIGIVTAPKDGGEPCSEGSTQAGNKLVHVVRVSGSGYLIVMLHAKDLPATGLYVACLNQQAVANSLGEALLF
jgi:hypothetical protein